MSEKIAIYTWITNESIFLPIWLSYYSKYFKGEDIYIQRHDIKGDWFDKLKEQYKFNDIKKPDTDARYQDYGLAEPEKGKKNDDDLINELFSKGYQCILNPCVDEFIIADPDKYDGLRHFIESNKDKYYHCQGYEIVQNQDKEPSLDFKKPLLPQRNYWWKDARYNKPIVFRELLNWVLGKHFIEGKEKELWSPHPDLYLFHLHRIDLFLYIARLSQNRKPEWFQLNKEEFTLLPERFKKLL